MATINALNNENNSTFTVTSGDLNTSAGAISSYTDVTAVTGDLISEEGNLVLASTITPATPTVGNIQICDQGVVFHVAGGNSAWIGSGAGASITGADSTYSIGIGYNALFSIPGGAALGQNNAIGANCLHDLVGGGYNLAFGGSCAYTLTSGSFNILFGGYGCGPSYTAYCGGAYTGAESGNILIANYGVVGTSNQIRIGTQGTTRCSQDSCFIAGIYGGTGSTGTSGVVLVDNNPDAGQLTSLSGASGTILVGAAAPKFLPAGNSGQILASQGAAVDPHWIDNTLYGNVWTDITGASQAMLPGNAYTANKNSLVTFTLPATAAYGTTMTVTGKGTGYWKIEQNAGQTIHMGSTSTTTGVTGNITTAQQWASVTMVCIAADTDWVIISSTGTVVLA